MAIDIEARRAYQREYQREYRRRNVEKFREMERNGDCCKKKNSIDRCGRCERGVLCGACNQGIGMLRHDLDVLTSAIRYLYLRED